ncbi:GNAT family N-acetyltransferase [Georgenia sp. SYP-B2076]|uniref:GNAT family N-acetyltransferase n=1 Tax=Georgenia sp. SYP-B2076 TaxID=2495881 RepID=UPI000F8E7916|nr:GNAT family protein [Georgenia sp. SYP-B2076]
MPTLSGPDGRTLTNAVVTLRPLTPDDAPALFAALDAPEVWATGYGGGPAGRPADVGAMRRLMGTYLTGGTGGGVAYAVRHARTGDLVGTTTLGDIDLPNETAHLGWTAYSPAVWGTSVNPAAKLAVLAHAFEDCGLGRVRLQVDILNARSQAAVARLGAAREGVARRHRRRADGTWRDSVMYSILRDEWPAVRSRLEGRLGRGAVTLDAVGDRAV